VDYTENKLVESYDELSAANEELQAYVQQLTASEEELRNQYDQIVEFDKMLRQSEENFRNLFEHSSDSIFLLDGCKIINCNNAAVKMLGYESRDSIIGKDPMDFTLRQQPNGMDSKQALLGKIEKCMKNEKTQFEWWFCKKDGSFMPSDIMMTAIMSNGVEVVHAVCRDISDRKEMEERLHYLSYHDQLTELYNRRHFEEELIRLDEEEYYPLMITMADINGLKLINDSFGHTIGDEYIKKVAKVLSEGVRENDVVCRLAGDEFIIFSPNTQLHEVKKVINHIKDLAKQQSVSGVDLSISFGYCSKNNKDESILEVLKKAEDFMYKKKLLESPSMRGKTIYTIIAALHEKNPREEEHSHRVSELCEKMGMALGLQEDEVKELKTVGLLHDIGKVAIEEGILSKKGKLSENEWEEIKRHPEIGYRILSTVNELSEMAEYVLAHHERWDGKGYPKGLKGEEIPIQSRIIAVADAYDAMISERSYRTALSKEFAISELKKGAGTQFCEQCVDIFIQKVVDENI
jgi:diguanylate cyclase (GGDEF)-like protein/PAS domain S-box-containing protein